MVETGFIIGGAYSVLQNVAFYRMDLIVVVYIDVYGVLFSFRSVYDCQNRINEGSL